MRPPAVSIAFAVVICGAATSARADSGIDDAVVAILPLVSSAQDLEIYSGPVAQAVVASLKKKVSMRVEAVSLSGSIPDRVTLVVDGRIIGRGKTKVMLSASVRDPARGTREGTVSTRVRALTEIDKLAAELAALLSPVLTAAASKSPAEHPPEGPTNADVQPVTNLSGNSSADEPPADRVDARPTAEDRPAVIVVPPDGTVAGGAVNVGPSSYAPMTAAVNRLGFAAVRSGNAGIVGPTDAASELSRTGAEFALMIQVKSVDFTWHGVLSARGKVRVVLVDRTGEARVDRVVKTGTLVGSRGDRHAALVGFVAEQAVDIAYPALRQAMR